MLQIFGRKQSFYFKKLTTKLFKYYLFIYAMFNIYTEQCGLNHETAMNMLTEDIKRRLEYVYILYGEKNYYKLGESTQEIVKYTKKHSNDLDENLTMVAVMVSDCKFVEKKMHCWLKKCNIKREIGFGVQREWFQIEGDRKSVVKQLIDGINIINQHAVFDKLYKMVINADQDLVKNLFSSLSYTPCEVITYTSEGYDYRDESEDEEEEEDNDSTSDYVPSDEDNDSEDDSSDDDSIDEDVEKISEEKLEKIAVKEEHANVKEEIIYV